MIITNRQVRTVLDTYLQRFPLDYHKMAPLFEAAVCGHQVARPDNFIPGHVTAEAVVVCSRGWVLHVHDPATDDWRLPGRSLTALDPNVRRACMSVVAETTDVSGFWLQPGYEDTPIDVAPQSVAPRPERPAHMHYRVRYLFRVEQALGDEKHLRADRRARWAWKPPMWLADRTLAGKVTRVCRGSNPAAYRLHTPPRGIASIPVSGKAARR